MTAPTAYETIVVERPEPRGQLAFLDTPGVHKASYELGRMMNQEGLASTPRLRYIVDTVMVPLFGVVGELIARLRAADRIRPVTVRGLFFLVGHGAEAPFTLTALSEAFAVIDGSGTPSKIGA